MGKKALRLAAAICGMVLVFTAACAPVGGGQEKGSISNLQQEETAGLGTGEGTEQTSGRGRYREEKVDFPATVRTIFDAQCTGGSIKVLFEDEPGSFLLYESKDDGVSWTQMELGTEWMPEGYRAVAASFGAGGCIAVSAGKMSEDPMDEKRPVGEYAYFLIEGLGGIPKARPLGLQVPKPGEGDLQSGYGLKQILLADDGKVYGMIISGEDEMQRFQILCFASDSGGVLWQKDTEMAEIALFGDKLYLNGFGGGLVILDPKSGETLGNLPISLRDNLLCSMDVNVEKEKIFYCNEGGIYGTDYGMALTELLADGKLSVFSSEESSVKGFFAVNEKVFLLFTQNYNRAGMEALRYVYDETLPTQPKQELAVYSLKENKVAKKIVSDFQASHPEVSVEYEVGMKDDAAREEADAISSLNTEIMAGNGPDVLILNGLPWKSFGEKGVLKDLGGDLEAYTDGGKGFANLFRACQTDGVQYAAPICFKFPAMIGEAAVIAKDGSAKELLRSAKAAEGLPPFSRSGQNLLRFMLSIYWQNMQQEDGTISREKLKGLLQTVKELDELLLERENEVTRFFRDAEGEAEKTFDVFANDASLSAWDIKYKNVATDVGYLSNLQDFRVICDYGFSYQTLSEGVFSALLMGINRDAKNAGMAEELLAFALSEEEQEIFPDGMYGVIMGFPVNRATFDNMVSPPFVEEPDGYAEESAGIGETYGWPKEEAFARLRREIDGLATLAMEDGVTLSKAMESGGAYLSGGKTADAAADEIAQALELMRKE